MKCIFYVLLLIPTISYSGELAESFKANNPKVNTVDYKQVLSNSRSYKEIRSSRHGISQIGLERTICYGKCPAYSVIIKEDGTFRFTGYAHIEKLGPHTGRVSPWELRSLLQYIKTSNFVLLQDRYTVLVTDNPTTYTMAVIDGKTKLISNYANGGPITLWMIGQVVDKLLLDAEWD